jgi:hypothetical protein
MQMVVSSPGGGLLARDWSGTGRGRLAYRLTAKGAREFGIRPHRLLVLQRRDLAEPCGEGAIAQGTNTS